MPQSSTIEWEKSKSDEPHRKSQDESQECFQIKGAAVWEGLWGHKTVLCTPWLVARGNHAAPTSEEKAGGKVKRKMRWEQSRVRVNEKTAQDFLF